MGLFRVSTAWHWPLLPKPVEPLFSWPTILQPQKSRFSFRLPFQAVPVAQESPLQRSISLALPFLKLNSKAKTVISLTTATKTSVVGLYTLAVQWNKLETVQALKCLWQPAMATSQIASTLVNMPALKLLALSLSLINGGIHLYTNWGAADRSKLANVVLQIVSTVLSLVLFFWALPELVLASIALSTGSILLHTSTEFTKGRLPEAVASFILAGMAVGRGQKVLAQIGQSKIAALGAWSKAPAWPVERFPGPSMEPMCGLPLADC